MRARYADASINFVQRKFELLNPTQRANVYRRLAAHRAKIPRVVWLFALSTTIDLELSGSAPAPDSCPGCAGATDPTKQLREESVSAVCMINGLPPKPW